MKDNENTQDVDGSGSSDCYLAMKKMKYMIEPGDWEAATGEGLPVGSDGVVVQKVPDGEWSTCEWEYNDEYERWDSDCENVIALHGGESPFDYGFKFCPYCGKEVREM